MSYIDDRTMDRWLEKLGQIESAVEVLTEQRDLYRRLYKEERCLVADQAGVLYEAGEQLDELREDVRELENALAEAEHEILSLELSQPVVNALGQLAEHGCAWINSYDRDDFSRAWLAHTL